MTKALTGSIETLGTLKITADTSGLDAASKRILRHKEILAIIAKDTIEEYQGYNPEEIMEFIEADSISAPEVSRGWTNTIIHGDSEEFTELNEKTTAFDVFFRARNPELSKGRVNVNLHVDLEAQRTYRPGYPIEKRGIYYLARSLSSQLSLLTERTDYGQLEKCYSIWICRDDIPEKERFSITHYTIENYDAKGRSSTKKADYDLMHLVIIRLGSPDYSGEEDDIFRFLTTLFYPRKPDFRETIDRYLDFGQNPELEKEVGGMIGLGQSILEEGIQKGEDRVNRLNGILLKEHRYDDLRRSTEDRKFQQELFLKYHLE